MKMPTVIAYECLNGELLPYVPEFISDFVIKVATEIAKENGQSLIEASVCNSSGILGLELYIWPKMQNNIKLSFDAITDSAIDLPKMIKAKCEAMPDLKMTRCIDAKEGRL